MEIQNTTPPKSKVEINEDMGLQDQWYEKAISRFSFQELPNFFNHVFNDFSHTKETFAHAMVAALLATAYAVDKSVPASKELRLELKHLSLINHAFSQLFLNSGPCRIIQFFFMLFPENKFKFEKVIDEKVWNYLVNQAKIFLDHDKKNGLKTTDAATRAHWETIANGELPWGYKLIAQAKEEEISMN